jgi:hypothetical protein
MSRVRAALVVLVGLLVAPAVGAQTVSIGAYGLPPLTCLAPQGEIVPGIPVAYVCGRDGRLDDPIDSFLRPSVRTRAGVVNPQGTPPLLAAARAYLTAQAPTLGGFPDLFAELSSLPLLDIPGVPQQVRNGLARSLRAEDLRNPAFVPSPPQQALLAEWAASLNARFPALLEARREPDRAEFVFTQRVGAGPVADTVAESAAGMADNLFGAITIDDLLGPIEQQNRVDRIPFFIGPDGRPRRRAGLLRARAGAECRGVLGSVVPARRRWCERQRRVHRVLDVPAPGSIGRRHARRG